MPTVESRFEFLTARQLHCSEGWQDGGRFFTYLFFLSLFSSETVLWSSGNVPFDFQSTLKPPSRSKLSRKRGRPDLIFFHVTEEKKTTPSTSIPRLPIPLAHLHRQELSLRSLHPARVNQLVRVWASADLNPRCQDCISVPLGARREPQKLAFPSRPKGLEVKRGGYCTGKRDEKKIENAEKETSSWNYTLRRRDSTVE